MIGRPAVAAACAVVALGAAHTLGAATAFAAMSPAQKAIYDNYAAAAKTADAAFTDFSASRGQTLFQGQHTGGKADTPSCTSCHTTDLKKSGRTRAGKEILPMAASVNPKRFTDAADVEKWFRRNCLDVLGRECTAVEKGDVLAYLLGL